MSIAGSSPTCRICPGATPSRSAAARKIRGSGFATPLSRAQTWWAKCVWMPMRCRSALPLVRLASGQRAVIRCSAGRLSGYSSTLLRAAK